MPAFFLNFGQNPIDLRQIPTNVTKVKRSRSAAVFWLHCYFWSIYAHIDGSQGNNITGGPTVSSRFNAQFTHTIWIGRCSPMYAHQKNIPDHTGSIISCLRTQHYIKHSESRLPQKSVFPIKTMLFFLTCIDLHKTNSLLFVVSQCIPNDILLKIKIRYCHYPFIPHDHLASQPLAIYGWPYLYQ